MIVEVDESKKIHDWMLKAVELVESRGFTDVKSKLDGYEDPISFDKKGDDTNYTPDITAEENHGKAYFELARKTDEVTSLVSKWKLLSTIAKMKKGSFHIIVPYGQNKFTQEILDKYPVEADLIKLPS